MKKKKRVNTFSLRQHRKTSPLVLLLRLSKMCCYGAVVTTGTLQLELPSSTKAAFSAFGGCTALSPSQPVFFWKTEAIKTL